MHLFYRRFIRTLIFCSLAIFTAAIITPLSWAQEKKKAPPAVPVRAAHIQEKTV